VSGKSPIDLSRIPAPNIVEALNFETIFEEMKAELIGLEPEVESVLTLESEPLTKILQVCAYRELLTRQRINEAAKGVMLAFAEKNDLDHLGALLNVARLVISEANPTANPPIEEVLENDDEYRLRIQLSLDGLSTAGPELAYIFHTLSASGQILDASVTAPVFSRAAISPAVRGQLPENSIVLQVDDDAGLAEPMPGDVVVTVLSRDASGVPDNQTLEAVEQALNKESVRPLTDNVNTRAASIIDYAVDATIYTYAGPDSTVVIEEAAAAINNYTEENKRLGRSITRSGIFAALHVAGVQRVDLTQPAADVTCTDAQAARNVSLNLMYGGNAQ